MTDRADHEWPDEEGGPQAAAGLRGDTGGSGDVAPGQNLPGPATNVGATSEGGGPETAQGPEGYGDLGSGTAGSAGSPESSGLKPGEGARGSSDPA